MIKNKEVNPTEIEEDAKLSGQINIGNDRKLILRNATGD